MKNRLPTLLTSLIWSTIYSKYGLANLANQCLLSVPTHNKALVVGNSNQLSVHIQADKVEGNYPENTQFSGNVCIEQDNSTLTADKVQLYQQYSNERGLVRIINANGNVTYSSDKIKLKGEKVCFNLNTKDIDVYQGSYQIVGRQGRGNADIMKQRGDSRYTMLEKGNFTSCLPGDNIWNITGSKVIYDHQENVVEIWNARFKIGKIPIFYSPYLRLPVGDKRRSNFNFFIPNIKHSSNNGFEFYAPYCFHGRELNYDVTVTPNYTSKRGVQIQTELHYLTIPWEGLVGFDWSTSNRFHSRADSMGDDDGYSDRWLLYWRHNSVTDRVWRFNIDYTKVSDFNYFNDLYLKCGDTTDSYAVQKLSLSYANRNWVSTLSYKNFQIFNNNVHDTYRAVPQLDITYYKNDLGSFGFNIFSQAVKFININNNFPKTIRLHAEPTINMPLVNSWNSLNTEAKLIMTYYQQEKISSYNKTANTQHHLKRFINRVIPQFKIDDQIVFERHIDCSQGYIQTLEPRLRYLYVAYRNQDNIGVYDSVILRTYYTSLFRDRIYSGLDRISSANQLTGGVTTRIYDDQMIERFNASIGQIYYFSQPRTGDISDTWGDYSTTGSVIWAGDSYWHFSNRWGIRGGIQYDIHLNNLALGDIVLEYRPDENHLLQLNYRYANLQYIERMPPEIIHSEDQRSISQIGITSSLSLIDRWSLVGTYYYDIKTNQMVDQLVGVQYNTCCWAVNASYERKITNWNKLGNSSKYGNKIMFNIELRGLSGAYCLSTDKMLSSGILPYQRAF